MIIMASMAFQLNNHLYLKDPQHTELGQNIISKSVAMIDQLGIEQFTFKKLALEIGSTEASIYRYFENKHRLLLYLVSWYWSWLDYRIDISTGSLSKPVEKLKVSLRIITEVKSYDPTFAFVDEAALHRILIAELDKTYLTKWVDQDNQEGLFGGFKSLCGKIAAMISEVDPTYVFPRSLVSTVLLAANQQAFFAVHLPSLTNFKKDTDVHESTYQFIENLVFNSLNLRNHA